MVVVRFVLSQFKNESLQRAAIFSYLFIYVFPVGYVVFSKLWVSASIDSVEEGTFCFKPSMSVRINQVPFLYFDKYNTVYTRYVVFFLQANLYALFGFVLEWIQHLLYVLPLGIVTGNDATKLSDFPPYLPFEVHGFTFI